RKCDDGCAVSFYDHTAGVERQQIESAVAVIGDDLNEMQVKESAHLFDLVAVCGLVGELRHPRHRPRGAEIERCDRLERREGVAVRLVEPQRQLDQDTHATASPALQTVCGLRRRCAQSRITTSRSLPDSPPQASPGRPSIWRTLAPRLSLGKVSKRSLA